jgi:hypothetical protein
MLHIVIPIMRLPICEFFCLTPCMHTGTPHMHTGTSSDVALTRQGSSAESRVNQIFLHSSAHIIHIKKQVGMVIANFIYFRATPPRHPVVRRPLLLLAIVVRNAIALARAPTSALALSS